MLQKRALEILKLIIGNKDISNEEIQLKMNLTQRQVNYDIDLLNTWLEENGYSTILKMPNGTYQFKNKNNLTRILTDIAKGNINYILSEEDRQKIIYLYLYLNYDEISLYHFIDLLEVSRGTVNNDLKKIGEALTMYGVSITYYRDNGYRLIGDEENIRYVMMLIVVEIVSYDQGQYIFQTVLGKESYELATQFKSKIKELVQNNKVNMSYNNLSIVSYIYVFSYIREVDIHLNLNTNIHFDFENLLEYNVAHEALQQFASPTRNQITFLETLLLSYSIGQEKKETSDKFIIKKIINSILDKLKNSYAINLENKKVFGQLYSHIRPAVYRMIFNYPYINPIKKEIKSQYQWIYILIKETIESLKLNNYDNISEDELSYLTIHFATFFMEDLAESNDSPKKLTGVIVCPNGVGYSVLLSRELSNLFPEILFLDTVSVTDFNSINKEVDVVFSTTLIETEKTLFLVQPIMSSVEKAALVKNFNEEFGNNFNEKDKIKNFLNRIEKYIDIKDQQGFISEVKSFLTTNNDVNVKRREPMLSEIVNEQLIQTKISAIDWRDAIRKSAAPLVSTKRITANYVEAMIKNSEEGNQYIVITKHVALPHARPEEGAKKVALGITTLKDPINFGNEQNDPVKYIFCLSAIDNKTHLRALSELVELLEDSEFYRILDEADNAKEIMDYIKKNEPLEEKDSE
ncbi:BglG family transcription antiterminator [Fundicoccus culcitae]|uniref:BglG family transcription antiterminator n=1 Tax=Fundicoccus culcitae TaxID=2969821 RepID=A0ABY5P5Q0_9LACT|nr:BglG family transcription antiterminator [Fundicoccus culcitae]UUX33753.1 BglG family transcription antiterminator [Fundicoccus culcitae]